MRPSSHRSSSRASSGSSVNAKSAQAAAPGAPAWGIADATELYRIDAWSDGFFFVNEAGRMAVRPFEDNDLGIDILDVVTELRGRGVQFPVLLRFQDVLRARVRRLNEAFAEAIADTGYKNVYRAIYPIKVNQLHEVVEEVLDAGRPYGIGLECGSKAELVATLALLESDATPLVCNGVKDVAMLSLILSAQRLGKNVIPVMEKYAEFAELVRLADEAELATQFGVRVRLRTAGSGAWADSGGYQSKFGISLPELLELFEALKACEQAHRFVLLHFHIGSQIAEIQQLRQAAKELGQIYAELVLAGAPLHTIDVGGGLGVNYTGAFERGSINYSLQEYANTVVSAIMDVCEQRGVPHPVLMSESGRAMTAHHSVLVVDTLGAYYKDVAEDGRPMPKATHRMTESLAERLDWLRADERRGAGVDELIEAYHDVLEVHQEAATMFSMGLLPLDQNALIERMYWSSCATILRLLRAAEPDPKPRAMRDLEELLVDQYLVDFSVFQSVIDHWAIDQPFPIVPLERLDEKPARRVILVDVTCDSDGKISRYVSANADKNFLELHPLEDGKTYYLGLFLMGAYQDIMGDSHNLFGRVTEAHVYGDAEEEGNFWIEKVLPGAKVQEMLAQVQYFPNDLQRRMQAIIKEKIDSGQVRPKRGTEIMDQYTACFAAGTYLESSRNGGN